MANETRKGQICHRSQSAELKEPRSFQITRGLELPIGLSPGANRAIQINEKYKIFQSGQTVVDLVRIYRPFF